MIFFTVGHTSTSVSLGVGLAKARDMKGELSNVVALIGDGSLSGGLAFEGLNNAGILQSNLIIIVNDNEYSIDVNKGSLYGNLKELRESMGKSSNNIFRAMGFDYRYLEQGNDLKSVIELLSSVKDIKHPVVLHVHTEKGHGYKFAVEDKMRFHWQSPFNLETGLSKSTRSGKETYQSIINEYMIDKIQNDGQPIVAINAAIPGAFGLKQFEAVLPGNYIDVGITEQHSITFASALASQGMKPFVFHLSTFLQRSYDQLSHDVAINRNPITLMVGG